MKREVLTAVAAIVLVFGLPSVVSAQPPPAFGYSIIETQIPQGAPLIVEVTGPANGTFNLTLNPLPFNTSQPVFDQFYSLPAKATLANNTAVGEVSINTTLFAIEGYVLTLRQANGSAFARILVAVTAGIDASALISVIEQIQFNAAVNASRITSLFYEQGRLQNEYLYVAVLTAVEFVILLLLIMETRTTVGEKRFMRNLKRLGHKAAFKGKSGMSAGHWTKEEPYAQIDPEMVWVADCCFRGQLRHTRPQLLAHMWTVHRMTEAEAIPMVRVSKDARREVQQKIQAEREVSVAHPPKVATTVLDLAEIQRE